MRMMDISALKLEERIGGKKRDEGKNEMGAFND